jgi:hypothetical protein
MMKPTGRIAALALVVAVLVPYNSSSAAEPTVVSIKAEIDVPSIKFDPGVPSGARTFEVTNVTAGDQVELTGANETGNPAEWCGTISVDVSPGSKNITVGPDVADPEVCDFETVKVTVLSPSIGDSKYVEGSLLETAPGGQPRFTRTITPIAGGVQILWQTTTPNESLDISGAERFSYTAPAVAAPPATAFSLVKPIEVTGKAKVGKKVKVTRLASAFTPAPAEITIQWFRGGDKIQGAKKATYKVTRADVGKKLKAKIMVFGSVPTTTFIVETKKVKH